MITSRALCSRVDGVAVRLKIDERLPAQLQRDLLRLLSGFPRIDDRPAYELQLAAVDGMCRLRCHGPGEGLLSDQTLVTDSNVPLHFVGELLEQGLAQPVGLRLHAAGLVHEGRTWAIVGASGSGKTTLTAAMLLEGARYLSDERLTLQQAWSKVTASGLRRPLKLRGRLEDQVRLTEGFGPGSLGSDGFRILVFCDAVPSVTDTEAAPLEVSRILLFDDPATKEPVHASRAAVVRRLIAQSMDAVRWGPRSLVVLARLVAQSEVYVVPERSLSELPAGVATIASMDDEVWVRWFDRGDRQPPEPPFVVVGMGDEVLCWLTGAHPAVLEIKGADADALLEVAEGSDDLFGAVLDGIVADRTAVATAPLRSSASPA